MTDIQYNTTIMGGPTGFGFSPKASGFYPFGDATALAGESGVGDVVWLIQATTWNQTCRSTNDRCEALASLKGCFFMFLFQSPQYLSTEPKFHSTPHPCSNNFMQKNRPTVEAGRLRFIREI